MKNLVKPTWTVKVQATLKSGKSLPAVAWHLPACDAVDASFRALNCAQHTGLPSNPVIATVIVGRPVRL